MSKNTDNFIQFVKEECRAANVKLVLSKSKTVFADGVKTNGYFHHNDKKQSIVLKCATSKAFKHWFPVFVHEYCHFQQYMDNCPAWVECDKEESDIVFEWIDGKEYDIRVVKTSIKRTVNIELDCEKRVVKTIKKFNLPIDIPTYIKQANSYVMFYNYCLLSRKWYQIAPYRVPAVYNNFRKDFRGNYKTLPKSKIKLYKTHCFI